MIARLASDKYQKRIIQFDLNGNEIARFKGVKKAAETVGWSLSGISNCIKVRSHFGFIWQYE